MKTPTESQPGLMPCGYCGKNPAYHYTMKVRCMNPECPMDRWVDWDSWNSAYCWGLLRECAEVLKFYGTESSHNGYLIWPQDHGKKAKDLLARLSPILGKE